jgi:hypothetical protein
MSWIELRQSFPICSWVDLNKYLEDLVARIDAPRLNGLDVTFFNQINFDTPHLAKFISRTSTFKALSEASVFFHDI